MFPVQAHADYLVAFIDARHRVLTQGDSASDLVDCHVSESSISQKSIELVIVWLVI